LLVKASQYGNLSSQLFQRLLFTTQFLSTSDIPSLSLRHTKRTAENTLSTPQKVGRTVENVLLPSNHKGIVAPRGYETH
jgi:hypothetical protein